jgi:myosin heavy subunit
LDSADRKEIADLINLIIKSWWEKSPDVSIGAGNGVAQSVQVKKLLHQFYFKNNDFEQKIECLNRELLDLKNNIASSKLYNIFLNYINMWWSNETSVHIQKEKKNYSKEVVFNALLENVNSTKKHIEALEQNQKQNITKAEIPSLVLQHIGNLTQQYNSYLQNHESRLNELAVGNKKLSENASRIQKLMEALEQNQKQNITKAEIPSLVLQHIGNFTQQYDYHLKNYESRLNGLTSENKKLLENASRIQKLMETLEQNQKQNITKAEIPSLVLQHIGNFKQQYDSYLENHESRLNGLKNENKKLKEEMLNSLQEMVRQLEDRLYQLEADIRKLKEEIDSLKRPMNAQQTQESIDSSNAQKINIQQSTGLSSSDQIIDEFNNWAKNPGNFHLPSSRFYYAEGDLKTREKQDIKQSHDDNNALWIVGTSGSTKYLFPNPNLIDQIAGDIDVLYFVTGTRKARGQNRVNIQKACVIKEDGWIEYKGELDLI